MLEKHVEERLVRRARELGGQAYKFTSPGRRNVPDRIVVLPGGHVEFIELKRPGAKPTNGQLREHDRLRALGCEVRVVDTIAGVDDWYELRKLV